MTIKWYQLRSGRLQPQPSLDGWPQIISTPGLESWFDIEPATPDELRPFLEQMGLHPVQIARCTDSSNDPGVITFGKTSLMEYPTSLGEDAGDPGYLSIIINESVLVTIRHGAVPSFAGLIRDLTSDRVPPLRHLPQIVYLILDHFADLNVEAQVGAREEILRLSKRLAGDPGSVKAGELSRLREKVDRLVSLVENQLYCVTGLSASDNDALRESHRKAYVQDLVSEAEIAQRGVYRLEDRLNNLYNEYQMAGNDRVERRLRVLTIISAITLPLGLIAGLLGMNVGGLPGIGFRFGFLIVVLVMIVIGIMQFVYFKRHGWFD